MAASPSYLSAPIPSHLWPEEPSLSPDKSQEIIQSISANKIKEIAKHIIHSLDMHFRTYNGNKSIYKTIEGKLLIPFTEKLEQSFSNPDDFLEDGIIFDFLNSRGSGILDSTNILDLHVFKNPDHPMGALTSYVAKGELKGSALRIAQYTNERLYSTSGVNVP